MLETEVGTSLLVFHPSLLPLVKQVYAIMTQYAIFYAIMLFWKPPLIQPSATANQHVSSQNSYD